MIHEYYAAKHGSSICARLAKAFGKKRLEPHDLRAGQTEKVAFSPPFQSLNDTEQAK